MRQLEGYVPRCTARRADKLIVREAGAVNRFPCLFDWNHNFFNGSGPVPQNPGF